MSFDNDNAVSAAAAAPAPESPAEETHSEVNSAPSEQAAPAETHAEAPAPVQASAAEPAHDAEAVAAAEEAAGAEEMSKLMAGSDEQQEGEEENEILEVKVVAYTEHGVVVDLGQKNEGLIPAAEFAADTEIPRPDPNSTIEVQRTGEKKDGYTIVSYQKVLRRRTWEKLEAAFKAKETLTGKIVDRIKGGVVVDVGVRAFLPGSQYDLRPLQNLDSLIGQEVQVRITKLNRRRGNIVVSRRALLEEELHAKRAELLEKLSEGQTVHATLN